MEVQGLGPMTLGASLLATPSHPPALPLFIASLETPCPEVSATGNLQLLIPDTQLCHILLPPAAQEKETSGRSVF